MLKLWIILLILVHSAHSFSNVFISELLGLGYSHGGITGKAIQKISYEYLDVRTEAEFLEKLKLDLWTQHIAAVDLIERFNDNVDSDPQTKNRPMYHFDAERFVRGNNLLITSQELIVNSIRTGQYTMAREQLGKYLHTHQDFYSHSNWIEMSENGTYHQLGEPNAFNDNVATINMSTCLNCRKRCEKCDYECIDNIIPSLNHMKVFTSGYYEGEVEDNIPVVKPTNVLKCSHGGIIDTTSDIPALGGINKDVKTSLLSPHYYHQEKAAYAAIESTYLFLKKLWRLTEIKHDNTSHFGRLLELVPGQQSLTFIIDHSNNTMNDIANIKIVIRNIIIGIILNNTNSPCEIRIVASENQSFSIVAKSYGDSDIDRLFSFLDNLTVKSDTKLTMDAIVNALSLSNDHCVIYVFTNELSNDHERSNEVALLAKRKNCHIHFILSNRADKLQMKNQNVHNKLQTYHTIENLAFETNGLTVNFEKEHLSSIVQFVNYTGNTNLIPIIRVHPSSLNSSLYTFYIDSSVEMLQFMISLKCAHPLFSTFDVKNLFISPGHSNISLLLNFDGEDVKIGRIHKPLVGKWQLHVNSSLIKSFEIKINTSIHFQHSFNIFNANSRHPGLYPLHIEPIQGSQLYSCIRVLQYNSHKIVFDKLEFIDSSNHLLQQYKLIKQNGFIYTSKVVIPSVEFFIKIRGQNDQNEVIERLYPHKIIPRTLEVSAIIDSEFASYVKLGEIIKINFTTINHNKNTSIIDLKIVQTPPIFHMNISEKQLTLHSDEKQTNFFELKSPNTPTWIDKSSEITIIVEDLLQRDAFNTYSLRTTIIAPFHNHQPIICKILWPSGKIPHEMCQSSVDLCSSKHWDAYLNITDLNLSHVHVGVHSVVLTYYDNENILQSNKETIQFLTNDSNNSNLQLLLSPNDCCKKYADIIVYNQHGNKAVCMEFQKIGSF